MQNREIDRLLSKPESSQRERMRCNEKLLKEEMRRDLEEQYYILAKKSNPDRAYQSYQWNMEVLSPEITQLVQIENIFNFEISFRRLKSQVAVGEQSQAC
jgi:hypothetical protein